MICAGGMLRKFYQSKKPKDLPDDARLIGRTGTPKSQNSPNEPKKPIQKKQKKQKNNLPGLLVWRLFWKSPGKLVFGFFVFLVLVLWFLGNWFFGFAGIGSFWFCEIGFAGIAFFRFCANSATCFVFVVVAFLASVENHINAAAEFAPGTEN